MSVTNAYRPPRWFTFQTNSGVSLRVGFHPRPHLDEILALWLILRWATAQWIDEYCPNREVLLGIGLGPFDEHGGHVDGQYLPRKRGHSCATLVAACLPDPRGVLLCDFQPLFKLMAFVTTNDLGALDRDKDYWFDLAHVINSLYEIESNQETVIRWALQALDAYYAGIRWAPSEFHISFMHAKMKAEAYARGFQVPTGGPYLFTADQWNNFGVEAVVAAQDDFHQALQELRHLPREQVFETRRFDGASLKMAWAWNARRHAGAAIRYLRYDAFVQAHPVSGCSLAGGVQVYRNLKRKPGPFDLRPVAYQLKCLEIPELRRLPREDVIAEGYANEDDRWYFFVSDRPPEEAPPGEAVFNRSLTAPEIPPTELDPASIFEVLKWTATTYRSGDPYAPIPAVAY
jgi:hypothetical protein